MKTKERGSKDAMSPLRRSSRHHASTTAADREREMSKNRDDGEREVSKHRESGGKKKNEPSSSRKRRSETSKEDSTPPSRREKRERQVNREKDKSETHNLRERTKKDDDKVDSAHKVEVKVGKVEAESPQKGASSSSSTPSVGTSKNTLSAPNSTMTYNDGVLAEEGRNLARILDIDEHQLTVKEVIAKRMRNTRMRGLSRDLVRLISVENEANRTNNSIDQLIQEVTSATRKQHQFEQQQNRAAEQRKESTPPAVSQNPMMGGTLRDALQHIMPAAVRRVTERAQGSSPPKNGTSQSVDPATAFQDVLANSLLLTPTPFDPFSMWQAVLQLPDSYTGNSNEFNVEGVRYVRLTTLLTEEGFTIPVTVPVKITLPTAGTIVMPLCDGFRANLIPVRRRSIARWVYLVLKDSNLLVHKAFNDLLFDYSQTMMLPLEREEVIPLEELPKIPLTRPSQEVIDCCNGITVRGAPPAKKEYQYKPRNPRPVPQEYSSHASTPVGDLSSSSWLNSSISDPDFLKNYIAGLGVDSNDEESKDSTDPEPTTSESTHEDDSNSGEQALTNSRKVVMISKFDSGISVDDLSKKYQVDSETVRAIIKNRVAIIREQAMMCHKRNRVRRSTYVGLNVMMWKFFVDCRDNGLGLNGKQLKEHALTIAKQLGLHSFKGSEGWLDAFKRRHKIDLRTMTGEPVNYEEDPEGNIVCNEEPNLDDLAEEPSPSTSPLPHGNTDTLLAQATALASCNVHNTQPLDLHQIGITANGDAENVAVPSSQPAQPGFLGHNSDQNNGDIHMEEDLHPLWNNAIPSPSSSTNEECHLIASIVRSAATHCPDQAVASALDTIRAFILKKEPSLMSPFADLQNRLCQLAAPNSNSSEVNGLVQPAPPEDQKLFG